MNTTDPIIRLEAVSKVYPDGTLALSETSLSIPRGQFCVFLGSSGAGKSTLLRLINGLVEPTSGEVIIEGNGMNRKNLRRLQARVAMIHQQFNLVPRMTVLNNVLAGALYEVPTLRSLFYAFPATFRRSACRLIEKVGLGEDHLYRRASQLSGGQQQRVGIARAFILDPPIVLADEPVASLDPRISRDILHLLRQAAREKCATVLCSLHQVDLAREFADRVVGMRAGKVVFDGPPEDLNTAALSRIYRTPEETTAEENHEMPLPEQSAANTRTIPIQL